MTDERKLTKAVLHIIGVLSVVMVLAVSRAFVLLVLWNWFVTPTFGIAPPRFFNVIGLIAFVVLFTTDFRKPDVEPFLEQIQRVSGALFFMLVFGALFHWLGSLT